MSANDVRTVVVDVLRRIAPEIQPASLRGDTSVRDDLDLDSMDFLNFVLGLHERLHVEIPESDYPKLYTIDGAVEYLVARASDHSGTPA